MKLNLRKCTESDNDLIYEMANDPVVRKNSFNKNFIKYEDHCVWYENTLRNHNVMMYVVENNNLVIGQLRISKQMDKAIISYSILKEYRGKGYANNILTMAKEVALINDIKILEGFVKKDNVASRKAFIYNGFKEYEEKESYKYIFFEGR